MQIDGAKVCHVLARWLGWIASAIHILQDGPLDDPFTYWHLSSPVLSAVNWVVARSQGFNPSPEAQKLLWIALILSCANNTLLGVHHTFKAVKGLPPPE